VADAGVSDADEAGADDVIEVHLRVPNECDGWRLDHFMKRRIGRLSRTRIQEIIATQIELSGRRARAAAIVKRGEVVLLRRPVPEEPDVPRTFRVIHEDESVLVLDKPAGLPIHTTAKFFRNTLTALLRERYPGEVMDVAHRLDRETSGVMAVARGRAVASKLKRAFATREVKKTYLAVVHGAPPDEGEVDVPLKLLDTKTRVVMGPAADGLPARTRFLVRRRFAAHALVEAFPETGRQHQIRVHLAHAGHPILGDKLYGRDGGEEAFMEYCEAGLTPELLARFDGLARQALHAHRLTFPHPATGAPFTAESPLPADLEALLARL